MDVSTSTSALSLGQSQWECCNSIVNTLDDGQIPIMTFLLQNLSQVVNSNTPEQFTLAKLWTVYKSAVCDKSMDKLREHLQIYMLRVWEECQVKLETEQVISLASNFSGEDDKVDEFDEAILRLREVLLLFQCQVPQDFEKAFTKICREKKIPEKTDDGMVRQFFVYAENKAFMDICNDLSEEAVCQVYGQLTKKATSDFHATSSARELMDLTLSSSDMKNIKGLKEASFFCFVLGLFKEGLLNRVHMHHLSDYLENEEETNVPSQSMPQLQLYPLGSKPPGICIIFNMEEGREGAEHDFQIVENLFKETFKYDVYAVKNPKRATVITTIEKLKAQKNKFYDSLVVVFMSHGTDTCLKVADGELHRRVDLIDPITKIEWLAKKPKLFFQQACACREDGGSSESSGQSRVCKDKSSAIGATEPSVIEMYKNLIELEGIHPFADTLISYATKWYDAAARCTDTGSPYINILVDQLKRFGTKEPIEMVLRRVHYETNMLKMRVENETHRQAPYFESSLQKVFMFSSQ